MDWENSSFGIRLEQAGIIVNDQDKILALTMGLPSTYDAVIINFDSTPTDQLTLTHVISRLLNEEVRQLSGDRSDAEIQDEAMVVTPTPPHCRSTTRCRYHLFLLRQERTLQIGLPREVSLGEDKGKEDRDKLQPYFSIRDDDEDLVF